MKIEALEITTFKLKRGKDLQSFIAANADVDAWLLKQPGFQSRRITELDDGSVADVLVWSSVEAGKDAAARVMDEMGHSAVHAMIDQKSVDWKVVPVRHQVHKVA